MKLLPTVSTTSWESDIYKIIDHRLASYMVAYELDTDYVSSGIVSLEGDVSSYSNDDAALKERITSSIKLLFREYLTRLVVEVVINDVDANGFTRIDLRIGGFDSNQQTVDARKIFTLKDSKVVSISTP